MVESPTSELILEFVRSHPATSARAIQRGLSLAWGQTAFHLRRLVKQRVLVCQKGGRSDYYFPPGFPEVDGRFLKAMQSPVQRAILVYLAASGEGLRFGRIAELVHRTNPTVSFHLRALMRGQLVIQDTSVSPRVYRAVQAATILRVHTSFVETFTDRWASKISETLAGLMR
ncbi:MAG: helix-turn-helix domain-containing protein [Euryarchaeota archaeon]|nr:helix-turn-helix domain-containing protein [Euryarchaeota archaeon]MDE2046412.1 helix-turn-helix domain-containing protein [Thermoplasmata archaeon]